MIFACACSAKYHFDVYWKLDEINQLAILYTTEVSANENSCLISL